MIFSRHFDYGRSLREFAPIHMTRASVLLYTVFESFGDLLFIFGHKRINLSTFKWMVMSPIVRFAMRYGLYRGLRGTVEASIGNRIGVLANPAEPNGQ
jgi:hypothetical protein